MSDALIANASDVTTLLTFDTPELRDVAKEMKLSIADQRKFVAAVTAAKAATLQSKMHLQTQEARKNHVCGCILRISAGVRPCLRVAA